MKLRVGAILLMLSLAILSAATPRFILNSIPSAEYTHPRQILYTRSIRCSGTLEMQNFREIYATLPLMPSTVWVAQGDYVVAGDVLATIDQEFTQTMLQSSLKLPQTQSQSDAPLDLTAYEELAQSFGISSAQFKAAMASYNNQASAPTAVETFTIDDIPSEIIAPVSGIVTDVGLKADMLANPLASAFTIGDTQSYIALLSVRESDIALINVGNRVKLTGNGMGDAVYHGYVQRIYPVAKTQGLQTGSERVVNIEVCITNPDERLKHGFSTLADIYVEEPQNIMVIPYEAVDQDEENREFVCVYTNGMVEKRFITTGYESTYGVQVIRGLTPADIVLVNAMQYTDGQTVRLHREVQMYD